MRTLPLVLLLGLVACDTVETFPPEAGVGLEGVTLATDRDSYNNRSTVGLTLRNDGAEQVLTGVLECAQIERRTDAGWTLDLDLNDRACIAIGIILEPGDDLEGEVDLGDVGGVPGGTYRLVQGTSVGDVASPSFEVR